MKNEKKVVIAAGCIGTIMAWILIAVLWFAVSAGAVAVAAWCFGFVFKWRYAVLGAIILLIITILKPSGGK